MTNKATPTTAIQIEAMRCQIKGDQPESVRDAMTIVSRLMEELACKKILFQYDFGTQIAMIVQDAESPQAAHAQLDAVARYLQIPGGVEALKQLRHFATRFPREFVEKWTARRKLGGGHLSLEQWLCLSEIEDDSLVETLLVATITNGWTKNELRLEIDARLGRLNPEPFQVRKRRKPSVTISPILFIYKLEMLMRRMKKYCGLSDEKLFDPIAAIPHNSVTPTMLTMLYTVLINAGETAKAVAYVTEKSQIHIEEVKRKLGQRMAGE
jgi:hypothetical protein